jgi:hypothetical protein
MRFKYGLLVVGLALIVGLVVAWRQFYGNSEPTPEMNAPTPGSTDIREPSATKEPSDLNERWHQLAGDATVWRRADIKDPQQQFVFDLIAEKLSSDSGEITREQFLAIAPRLLSAPTKDQAPAKPDDNAQKPDNRVASNTKTDKNRTSTPKTEERHAKTPDTPPQGDHPANVIVFPMGGEGAEAEFRKLDVKGNGLLTYDEMDDGLRAERDRWDANRDGFIDLEEYRAYYRAHMRQTRGARMNAFIEALMRQQNAEHRIMTAQPKAPKPAATSTPVDQTADLPEPYRQFDTNHDGQIGLYEWLKAGQPIAQFLEKDLNGDGFLTPDELVPPEAVASGEAAADPGNLMAFQTQIGKRFSFRVTGAANGGVWGSEGAYTADSSLATAAVHAGLLKPGETGTVHVRIIQPPPAFTGTTAHGVTTGSFGAFPGAYRFSQSR